MNHQELAPSPPSQPSPPSLAPLLEARHVFRYFTRSTGFLSRRKSFAAVRDVCLTVKKGVTLGIIGESGCGKSTLGKMLAGLLPPSAGEIRIHDTPMYTGKSHGGLTSLNPAICKTVQMVFQDPNASLNPRMPIGESVGEPLRCLYPEISASERKEQVKKVLAEVGIAPEYANRYPHAFSGGQRQRIAIARALIAKPSVIICDEPTSSLDSSVQAQVLNLLDASQKKYGVSYVFISHDLAVVRHMSDEVAVMYNGSVVETGSVQDVFASPAHPYTHLLLDSVPTITTFKDLHCPLAATVPCSPPGDRPESPAPCAPCLFAPRCPHANTHCLQNFPELVPLSTGQTHCAQTGNAPSAPASPSAPSSPSTPSFPSVPFTTGTPRHQVRCFLASSRIPHGSSTP